MSSSYSLSETFTDQRKQVTCSLHVSGKIFAQNMFQFFNPTPIDKDVYVEGRCNRFVDIGELQLDVSDLSRELCSPGGYDRILQFLYVYYLIQDRVGVNKTSSYAINPFILQDILEVKIPTFFTESPHRPSLVEMINKFNDSYRQSNTTYIARTFLRVHHYLSNETIATLFLTIIKKLISKRLYIVLTLESVLKQNNKYGLHAVHAVNVIGDEIVVKNSWGESRTYQMKLNGFLFLKDKDPNFIKDIHFYFPVTKEGGVVDQDQIISDMDDDKIVQQLNSLNDMVNRVPTRSHLKKTMTNPRTFLHGDFVELPNKKFGIFLQYVNESNARIYSGSQPYLNPVQELKVPRMTPELWSFAQKLLTAVVELNQKNEQRQRSKLEKHYEVQAVLESEETNLKEIQMNMETNQQKVMELKVYPPKEVRHELARSKEKHVELQHLLQETESKVEELKKTKGLLEQDELEKEIALIHLFEQRLELSTASLERIKKQLMKQYDPKRKKTKSLNLKAGTRRKRRH